MWSHLACQYIKMSIESLVKICITKCKTKNPVELGSTRILLVNIPGLYISWCKQKARHRQTTNRIPELPTDYHFLDLFQTCYPDHPFWSRTFFLKSLNNKLHRFTIKVNQKQKVIRDYFLFYIHFMF